MPYGTNHTLEEARNIWLSVDVLWTVAWIKQGKTEDVVYSIDVDNFWIFGNPYTNYNSVSFDFLEHGEVEEVQKMVVWIQSQVYLRFLLREYTFLLYMYARMI